jgi:hypothetical protein
MKQNKYAIVLLVIFSGTLFFYVRSELVHPPGDYTTIGTVDGDLIVTEGSINIPVAGGVDLIINGDLKLNGGKTSVHLTLHIKLSGAIITRRVNGNAHVVAKDPGASAVGSIRASRISTSGNGHAYVLADHHITVTGSIITKGDTGDSFVKSFGKATVYGNIDAGSILTYAPAGEGYVHANAGHITVNGPIITESQDSAYAYAEGNIESEKLFLHSTTLHATASAERINVTGDIITTATTSGGRADITVRQSAIVATRGTFEDLIANNIYTKGYSTAYLYIYRNIDVLGDISTFQPGEVSTLLGGAVQNQIGCICATNITTSAYYNAQVAAQNGLGVSGDIITRSWNSSAGVSCQKGFFRVGSIFANAQSIAGVSFNQPGGTMYVKNTLRTEDVGGGGAQVSSSGGIEAGKIFINGSNDATLSVGADCIVKGPIVTKSASGPAYILSTAGDITAGSISTHAVGTAAGTDTAYIQLDSGSLYVREDIRTKSVIGSSYVRALAGNITARSIKTESPAGQDDSIQSAAGSGKFQLSIIEGNAALTVKDAEFDLDRDYVLNTALSLDGTCTINGKGHQLNIGASGSIAITSGSTLTLKNINLQNMVNGTISLAANTSRLFVDNVVWHQKSNVTFGTGSMHITGDLTIKGPSTTFSYNSTQISTIYKNATLTFDQGLTLDFDSTSQYGISFENSTSRLRFNASDLVADQDMRLTKGTLVIDNENEFSVVASENIYFGDGMSAANNLNLEFHGLSRLIHSDVTNQNV